jgi:hypothetical protein
VFYDNINHKNTNNRVPMSFHLNNAQQMAINDPPLSLAEREMKYLKDSWAETLK